MTSRKVFLFIEKELREHEDWCVLNQKEFIEKFFSYLPDKHKEKLPKKLDTLYTGWKTYPDKEISSEYKSWISDILKFDTNVWNKTEDAKKELVRVAIKNFLSPSVEINFSSLQIDDPEMTEEQKKLLKDITKKHTQENLKACEKYFEKKETNQSFLVELIKLLYSKKEYDLINSSIFPNLLNYNFNRRELQKIYAHTIGSLTNPKYEEAYKILNTLKQNNPDDKDVVDIQTALISNVRRTIFLSEENKETNINLLINYYQEVFDKTNDYYPGINLAYMLWLKQFIKNTDHRDQIKSIKDKSLKMITEHKDSDNLNYKYYASISEIEFEILLKKNQNLNLEIMLENISPDPDPVFRTKRQMEKFVELCENNESKIYIESAIDILNSYLQYEPPISKNTFEQKMNTISMSS